MYISTDNLNEIKKYFGDTDRDPTVHLLTPNEPSSTTIGLHLIEFLVKGILWELPNNPSYC